MHAVLRHRPEHLPLMRLSLCNRMDDLGRLAGVPSRLLHSPTCLGHPSAPTNCCSGMDDVGLTAYAVGMLGEYLAQRWQDKLAAVSAPWDSATTCFCTFEYLTQHWQDKLAAVRLTPLVHVTDVLGVASGAARAGQAVYGGRVFAAFPDLLCCCTEMPTGSCWEASCCRLATSALLN